MPNKFKIKSRYDVNDLVDIIALLRAPGGCPWDAAQTHESIKKNFIEETYEVIEAINKKNSDMLKEELGDILLQVALHTEIEREQGNFTFDDVANDIVTKLVARHPHVFGKESAGSVAQALDSWDSVKAKLKNQKSQTEAMASIPRELPALMRAQKIQHKASKAGFDWDDVEGAFNKIYEELDELKIALKQCCQDDIQDEFGDVLFSAVNIARFIGVDSEEALTDASDKFMSRFERVERLAKEQGIDMKKSSVEELDILWDKAKKK